MQNTYVESTCLLKECNAHLSLKSDQAPPFLWVLQVDFSIPSSHIVNDASCGIWIRLDMATLKANMSSLLDQFGSNRSIPSTMTIAIGLAVAVVLVPLTTWILSEIQARPVPAGKGREPPVAPYVLPYLQHLMAFFDDPEALYMRFK